MPKREVQITRGREGYGFTLSGQAPCFVSWISETSYAKDSGLQIGDYVLSINKEDLYEADHEDVVRAVGMSSGVLLMEVVDGLQTPSSKEDSQELISGAKTLSSGAPPSISKRSSHGSESKFYRTKRVLNELKNGSLFQDVFVALDSSPSNIDKGSRSGTTPRSKLKSSHSHSSDHLLENCRPTLPRNNSIKTLRKSSEELVFQAVVAYLGSISGRIEAPNDATAVCMTALKSSIKHLRAEQDIHQRVAIKVTAKGVRVFNADGDLMVLLDRHKLCFCSSCDDDDRFFSVATLHSNNVVKCYQFMVDPAMCAHKVHSEQAKRFGIQCNVGSGNCLEFPFSPSHIIHSIVSLYERNASSLAISKDLKHRSVTSHSMKLENSSVFLPTPSSDAYTHPPNEPVKKKMDYRITDGYSVGRRTKTLVSRLNMKNMSKSTESVRSTEVDYVSTESSFESLSGDLFGQYSDSVAAWSSSLDKLLEDPIGLKYFTEYLSKEFSQENIIFWCQCEKLRKIPRSDTVSLTELAESIYKCFLSEHASSPVNIDSTGQRLAEEAMNKPPHPDMFAQQQSQIYRLMEYDSYRRFLKSNLYSQCHWCQNNGMPLPLEENLSRSNSQENFEQQRLAPSSHGRKFFQRKPKKSCSSNEIQRDLSDYETGSPSLSKSDDDFLSSLSHPESQACKIVFWDGSSSIIAVDKGGATIRQSLEGLCEKRNVPLSAVDIYYQNEDRALAVDQKIAVLAGQEVRVERRTLFKLDLLPIKRSIGVKAKPSKRTIDVLKPVVAKYGLDFEEIVVTLSEGGKAVNLHESISVLDGYRVTIDYKLSKTMPRKQKSKQVNRNEEKTSRSAENSDTDDLIVAMSAAAESGKMNDQCGLISRMNLELPDFLKLPPTNPSTNPINDRKHT